MSFLLGVTAIISFILFQTVGNYFYIAGVKPECALILVVYYALKVNPNCGVTIGFLIGFTEDIFSQGGALGVNTFSKLFISNIIGMAVGKIYTEQIFFRILILFVASIVDGIIVMAILSMLKIGGSAQMVKIIFTGACYNTILGLFIFPILNGTLLKIVYLTKVR